MAAEGSRFGELGTSKRQKELENTALQSTLRGTAGKDGALVREAEKPQLEEELPQCDDGRLMDGGEVSPGEELEDGDGSPDGLEENTSEEERPQSLAPSDRELSLTDHLNKRLLLSFQEKLNQAEVGLLQRVQQSQNGEDDNRVQEEW